MALVFTSRFSSVPLKSIFVSVCDIDVIRFFYRNVFLILKKNISIPASSSAFLNSITT